MWTLDLWHLQVSPKVSEMMTWNKLYKAVCPGVELLNLSGPAFPWLSISNNLAGHFSQGLIWFISDTGQEGALKCLQGQALV